MKVLITGGAGFIGANLALHLNREWPSLKISVIDDLSLGAESNLRDSRVTFFRGSILDRQTLRKALDGVATVVHLAALGSVPRSIIDPISTHEANATGTLVLLDECRKRDISHFIVASSSSVYGDNPSLPKKESDWTRPVSPYGVSKLATEAYALAFQQTHSMKILALRFFNVYGPLQPATHTYAAVIPRLLNQALNLEPLTIYGDGSQTRDFTNVLSVCQVLERAIKDGVSSPVPINLAFGTQVSVGKLAELIGKITSRPIRLVHQPPRPGDILHSVADSTMLHKLFPSASAVPIELGLLGTYEWMKSLRSN